ncbi:MAG: 16S rRNA (guanine(966)-N(2))-methyltransferase RsmD [Candidatus Nomurabacteria bacterium]|jgi:16S rRNA (guanine966-N2)-methyltransferase|nr:16S rRNA (guanine(966)-N(2))-methyltransferase RsmD [Candidatus Nomurabacteria bacterium]
MARVRIIAGEFGGRWISADVKSGTQPMSDQIRTSIFSMLESRGVLTGARVLDAFAGTGALGLESLSRGAAFATFLERDRTAAKVIDVNITTLDVQNRTKLTRTGVGSWTKTTKDAKYDIIFADPPYHNPQFSTVFELVKHLQKDGLLVLSYPERGTLPDLEGVVVVDKRIDGEAAIALFRLPEE